MALEDRPTHAHLDALIAAVTVLKDERQAGKWKGVLDHVNSLGRYVQNELDNPPKQQGEKAKSAFARRDDIIYAVILALSQCEGTEQTREELAKLFPHAGKKAENWRRTSIKPMDQILPELLPFELKRAAAADALAEYITSTAAQIANGKTPAGNDYAQNTHVWKKSGYTGESFLVEIPNLHDSHDNALATSLDKQLYKPLSDYIEAEQAVRPTLQRAGITSGNLAELVYEKLDKDRRIDEFKSPQGKIDIKIIDHVDLGGLRDDDDEDQQEHASSGKKPLEVNMTLAKEIIQPLIDRAKKRQ